MSRSAVGQAGGDRCHTTKAVINPGGFWLLPTTNREKATVTPCQETRITHHATGSGMYQHLRRIERPSVTVTSTPRCRLFLFLAIISLPRRSRSISFFISQPMLSILECPPMGSGIIRMQEGWRKHSCRESEGSRFFMSVVTWPQSGIDETLLKKVLHILKCFAFFRV